MLKKLLAMVAVLMCLLGAAQAQEPIAGAENVPDEVRRYIVESGSWPGWEITGWVQPGGGGTCFAAVKNGRNNDLLCFTWQNNAWAYAWHNDDALPRTTEPVLLGDATGTTLFYSGRQIGTAFVSYYVLNGELMESCSTWENQRGAWHLVHHTVYEPNLMFIQVEGNRLFFSNEGWVEGKANSKYVYGVQQTNLRYISMGQFPVTVAQAQEKLSNPPAIPEGELQAERIKFTGGKKYAVYQGPGEEYGRGANGKAVVSTNDWIQVFGREGDWVMIQYDISGDEMRIGWIRAEALPRGAKAAELNFAPATARVNDSLTMTDDPLGSRRWVITVGANTAVTWLSTMGDWAYIEIDVNGQPLRGFVMKKNLETVYHEAVVLAENLLTEVYGYTVEEAQDGFTYDISDGGETWAVALWADEHPQWVYQAEFRKTDGKFVTSHSPFANGYALYPGEGVVRYTMEKAGEEYWLADWHADHRAAWEQWLQEWQLPLTARMTQGLADGSLTAAEAVTELFLGCWGPMDTWTEACRQWHDEWQTQLTNDPYSNG